VVPVDDAGEADGHVYIALRFVAGTDLGAEFRRGPIAVGRAVDIAGQLAAALTPPTSRAWCTVRSNPRTCSSITAVIVT
jgi:hypothetical protein